MYVCMYVLMCTSVCEMSRLMYYSSYSPLLFLCKTLILKLSIATELLRSWGGPYVGWTKWKCISDFAFAAAILSKISID